jgi:lysophospholipase L1-like esterase
MKKILLLGDSIRMSYQIEVQIGLEGRAKIFAPVENCRHSANFLEKLPDWLQDFQPDLVHFNAGLHDLIRGRENGLPQFPLEVYERNLRQILAVFDQSRIRAIFWASTTPVHDAWNLKTHAYPMRANEDVLAYNRAADRVMADAKIPTDDLYRRALEAGLAHIQTPDGVHYTEAGQKALGKAVVDFLSPHLSTCRMP